MKAHKIGLRMFGNICLFFIVWMTISASQSILLKQSGPSILYLVLITSVQYIVFLIINYILTVYILSFPIESAIAVTIMASQKSTPVALVVISSLTSDSKQLGLLAVPCIIGTL